MAILHYAYLFKREAVESMLKHISSESPAIGETALRGQAKGAVLEGNPWTADFLTSICFDDEWLIEEPDVDDTERLLVVAVSKALCNRTEITPMSFEVIKALMPDALQSSDVTQMLLKGRRLRDFVESFARPDLVQHISPVGTIGWLGQGDTRSLIAMLEPLESRFFQPDLELTARLKSSISYVVLEDAEAQTLIKVAFQQAMDRLRGAALAECDLLIFNG